MPSACNAYVSDFLHLTDAAVAVIYTLSLHDALPIYEQADALGPLAQTEVALVADLDPVVEEADETGAEDGEHGEDAGVGEHADRKSTRLNSSHSSISYAVFCVKKKQSSATSHLFALT